MPLIAYQSFNSNSAKEHDLGSIGMQRFTVDTNRHVTSLGHQALVLPYIPGNLSVPVEGPAHLKPVETLGPKPEKTAKKRKRDDAGDDATDAQPAKATRVGDHTALVLGSQISLAWQNFYREFGEMPAIMVCGELDSSNSDFQGMIDDTQVSQNAISSPKACQSFTAYASNAIAASMLGSGTGYVVFAISNLNIAFVHVPNAICKSVDKVAAFYKSIAQSALATGKVIHLVIGDTNQTGADFTSKALNTAFQTSAYKSALAGTNISKIDNYQVTEQGTNSKGSMLYDVAVYRSDIVQITKNVAYISQSSSATTVTDHCGLGIVIDLKPAN